MEGPACRRALLPNMTREKIVLMDQLPRENTTETNDGPIPDPHGIAGDGPRRILLVDDNLFTRSVLVPLLSNAGFRVTGVKDAAAALALCRDGHDYDAIVSDIETAAQGGLELAETLRGGTQWRDTPMVALSAQATPRDQVRARLAGFDDHVVKSDRKALLRALEALLGLARGAA